MVKTLQELKDLQERRKEGRTTSEDLGKALWEKHRTGSWDTVNEILKQHYIITAQKIARDENKKNIKLF